MQNDETPVTTSSIIPQEIQTMFDGDLLNYIDPLFRPGTYNYIK